MQTARAQAPAAGVHPPTRRGRGENFKQGKELMKARRGFALLTGQLTSDGDSLPPRLCPESQRLHPFTWGLKRETSVAYRGGSRTNSVFSRPPGVTCLGPPGVLPEPGETKGAGGGALRLVGSPWGSPCWFSLSDSCPSVSLPRSPILSSAMCVPVPPSQHPSRGQSSGLRGRGTHPLRMSLRPRGAPREPPWRQRWSQEGGGQWGPAWPGGRSTCGPGPA